MNLEVTVFVSFENFRVLSAIQCFYWCYMHSDTTFFFSEIMSNLKLYCTTFCPFAQRAWIALLLKKVDFEYIEQDPYNKSPEWLAVNPRGLVPVIVHNGKSVYESPVCLEYIEEVWPAEPNLLPKDSYDRAYARIWGDFTEKKLIPPFYACLVKQTEEEQNSAKQEILENLIEFSKAMDQTGPYFQGSSLGYTDVMFAPWAMRIPVVLKHYRSFDVPKSPEYERYHKWLNAVKVHPTVVDTLLGEQAMLEIYKRYAFNTANSEVAQAIRSGKSLP